ncbi:MAG: threonine/serine dehydratase [Oscillibacter sp.]|nr:threonine/serine dehydratase [Oscillibacter sp.]
MLGQTLEPVQISDFWAAERQLRTVFPPSPLLSISPLDQKLGYPVYLKAESLLPSAAYKFRGATNKITTLMKEHGKDIRIVTASSGNHGMACALAANRLGIQAAVVVPVPTPQMKKDAIRALGADLLEIGETYDESFIAACELAEKEGRFYVHPVADRYTVAGQGTITLEILQQLPDVEQVIVPLGGGGLITGISFAMKQLRPSVKIVGVMPEGSAVYYHSRKAGKLLTLDKCASIADACVRKTGEEYLFPYIEANVDDIVTVTEDSIRQAVKTACLYGKLTLEGAAAMPLASLLEGKCQPCANTVLICSGGNIDQTVLEDCLKA